MITGPVGKGAGAAREAASRIRGEVPAPAAVISWFTQAHQKSPRIPRRVLPKLTDVKPDRYLLHFHGQEASLSAHTERRHRAPRARQHSRLLVSDLNGYAAARSGETNQPKEAKPRTKGQLDQLRNVLRI